MPLINHPDQFKFGIRCLFLKSRHKDGFEKEREIVKITFNTEEFNKALEYLDREALEGERIYATAGPRDLKKAVRCFQKRQLDAMYDSPDVFEGFYKNLRSRWVSSLCKPESQAEKVWLFDCDKPSEASQVLSELKDCYPVHEKWRRPYHYKTKSGHHVIVSPFNKMELTEESRKLLNDNPLMLWRY